MLLFEFCEQAASGTRIPCRRQVALPWSRPESAANFGARHWFVAQQPNKSPDRNARWSCLVVRRSRWFFHIVGRRRYGRHTIQPRRFAGIFAPRLDPFLVAITPCGSLAGVAPIFFGALLFVFDFIICVFHLHFSRIKSAVCGSGSLRFCSQDWIEAMEQFRRDAAFCWVNLFFNRQLFSTSSMGFLFIPQYYYIPPSSSQHFILSSNGIKINS